MKTLFTITAALSVLLGFAWMFFPEAMLSSWGAPADRIAVYMSRRYGGLFVGYAAIVWLARGAARSEATRAILAGGALVTAVMAVISVVGAVTGTVGPVIWSAVGLETVLAAAFGYQYATAR